MVRVDDRMYRCDTSFNYVGLLLPDFPDALVFNLPSCVANGNQAI